MKEFSPSTFRLNHANLNVLVEILDAWFATEANVLTEAYVGEDGSGIKVMASLNGGPQRVETEVSQVAWRITEEQREHMGYPVTVAVGETGGTPVEAWFAPDIPVSGGPAAYGGLPGMILMLSLDGGRTTYAATEISLDGIEDGSIRMPEGGRSEVGGIVPVIRRRSSQEIRAGSPRQRSQVREYGMYRWGAYGGWLGGAAVPASTPGFIAGRVSTRRRMHVRTFWIGFLAMRWSAFHACVPRARAGRSGSRSGRRRRDWRRRRHGHARGPGG